MCPVGFYAGLNLIAWLMIFCFVRETKQLTLEELDRESISFWHRCIKYLSYADYSFSYVLADQLRRDLLGPNGHFHLIRVKSMVTMVHQAIHRSTEDPKAASSY